MNRRHPQRRGQTFSPQEIEVACRILGKPEAQKDLPPEFHPAYRRLKEKFNRMGASLTEGQS